MRVGNNPNKDLRLDPSGILHQVVIPVYIPELKEYFAESLEILKLCLGSLEKTSTPGTFITIVNNGSCKEVSMYLDGLLENNQINELIHTSNIGKINAVIKGIVGHYFPLITISDADVLFLNGWQNATIDVFNSFPKAGVVGLTPQFKSYESNSGNLLFENLLSNKLGYTEVKDPESLKRFYHSIGWDTTYNKDYLQKQLTITGNSCRAVVGSGHYVATYRRELFKTVKTFQDAKLGVNSEKEFDRLPLKKGLWRLTTEANFAYHMGNVEEDWMEGQIAKLKKIDDPRPPLVRPIVNINDEAAISYFIKNRVFVKIFSFKNTKRIFYYLKGLPKEMRKDF